MTRVFSVWFLLFTEDDKDRVKSKRNPKYI